MATTTINATQFAEVCDRVWSDRAEVLSGSDHLSGEAALVRAVFWRLCNAGLKTKGLARNDGSTPALAYQSVVRRMLEIHGRPVFDCAPILRELGERYKKEAVSVVRK